MGIENYHIESDDNTIIDRITEVDELRTSFQFQYDSYILAIADKMANDPDYDYNEELLEAYTSFTNSGRNVDWNTMVDDVKKKAESIKKSHTPQPYTDDELKATLDRINSLVPAEAVENSFKKYDNVPDLSKIDMSPESFEKSTEAALSLYKEIQDAYKDVDITEPGSRGQR